MSTASKSAFSSSHDAIGMMDFDQILSDLCDLEHQLNEQSNLNEIKPVDGFPNPSSASEQASKSSLIFKDYSQLNCTSPCKPKLSGGSNTPNKSDHSLSMEADCDLSSALLELSALVGPGFDLDGNTRIRSDEPDRSSSDLENAVQSVLSQSRQFSRGSNGTNNNNNNNHARSKSMENGTLPRKSSSVSSGGGGGALRNNWQEHLSDGGQNDSAFDDNVSLPSSGSRISMATSSRSSGSSITNGVTGQQSENSDVQRNRDSSRAAIEKSNQENINKIFVRIYSPEGSSENTPINDHMSVWQVVGNLLSKNHLEPNISWSLVEHLPGLYMERLLEDNERLSEVVLSWTKDSENRLLLAERPDKYDIFVYPEKYLTTMEDKNKKCDETVRQVLIQEFLDSNCRLPEFDGMLYIKLEGKKAWKKLYFILRASGIYYSPKGKSKSLIDLVCLQRLDLVEVYTGIGWKKKYKAPNDFGFALKHPQIQKKAPKYIKYFCAEDMNSLWRWVNSIRLAKYGQSLHGNFLRCQNSVNQFFGEDPIARSKQTALIQEKISEMFSQQVESSPSFSSAAEFSPSLMQTFRAESPDGSSSKLLMSCLEENDRRTPSKTSSPVHTAADISNKFSGNRTKSPIKIVPPKAPKKLMTESISIHHLPPSVIPVDSADDWHDSDFPLPPGHEMLSGSVDQLQNVGSSSFGRVSARKTITVTTSGNIGKWTANHKHAVIKRTPSMGHRDVDDPPPLYPPLGPAKPLPLPKPSFSPAVTTFSTTLVLQSPSSLPPVRRKFPSSTSFSDCDDGRTSLTPRDSPKPKPPLPPKRKDILKQSVSVDNSPTRGRFIASSVGSLTLPKKPPPVRSRPSSGLSQQSLSPPPCVSPVPSMTMSRSPSSESRQSSSFLMDLERVILQKQVNGAGFARDVTVVSRKMYDSDDMDSLPPPPAALLAGLKKSNRPPLPPKRSNETQLTFK